MVKVVKGLPAGWGTCTRTVTLSFPWSLTCQKNTIAVGLEDQDIVILDGITGTQTAILSGHTDYVISLAFSSDGTSLVSGSGDKTIKLWDVQTGGVVKTFYGHTDSVQSVSISADCTMIASGSHDKTIRLWNIQTEECCHVIEQQYKVDHVLFFPTDPQHLMSATDCEIQQWDISGNQIGPTHFGYDFDLSWDGTQLVLCQEESVVVQNTNSGANVAEFYVANGEATHGCFSPDGRLIAVAADYTAYVWDTTSSHPHPIETLVGHTQYIKSLVFFSPSSLVSLSDNSIKFWQIGALQTDPIVTDPEPRPLTSAPIKSITLQAEDSIVISRDSQGVVRTWDISTGLCKSSFQTPPNNAVQSDVRLIDSRLVFVWRMGCEMHIWDAEGGELQMLDGMYDYATDVRISGDGSKVFCLHWNIIHTWSVQTGEIVDKLELEFVSVQRSLTVDGSRVWVHSPASDPQGWDFGTPGSPPLQLSNASLLHPNCTKWWNSKQSMVKDAVTGKVVFQLAGRFAKPVHSQWDGQYLVAGYESGEVMILDFHHG